MKRQFFRLKDVEDQIDIKEVVNTRYKISDNIYARIKDGTIIIFGESRKLTVYILEQIISIFVDKMRNQKKKLPIKTNVFYYSA